MTGVLSVGFRKLRENMNGPEVRQHLKSGPNRHNLDERP